jgi:hypothetical protein
LDLRQGNGQEETYWELLYLDSLLPDMPREGHRNNKANLRKVLSLEEASSNSSSNRNHKLLPCHGNKF